MKTKTYKEISQELFENGVYYTDSEGYIFYEKSCYTGRCNDDLNATSNMQIQKLFAFNKLMNVAKYLNKDWSPNWHDPNEKKYFIYVNDDLEVIVGYHTLNKTMDIVFKSEYDAIMAINILGKSFFRDILFSNY